MNNDPGYADSTELTEAHVQQTTFNSLVSQIEGE